MGLVAPRHAGSSRTRAWTCVPCIGRQTLNPWTARDVLVSALHGRFVWWSQGYVPELQACKDDIPVRLLIWNHLLCLLSVQEAPQQMSVGFAFQSCPLRLENTAPLVLPISLQVFSSSLSSIWPSENLMIERGKIEQLSEVRLWSQVARIWSLTPLLTSCVNLGKSVSFSVPRFPHLWKKT